MQRHPLDEVVLTDVVSLHIEDMGEHCWIGVERSDGDRLVFEIRAYDGILMLTQTEGSIGSLQEGEHVT